MGPRIMVCLLSLSLIIPVRSGSSVGFLLLLLESAVLIFLREASVSDGHLSAFVL
jgi:hypothetical protein